ncbi:MAG: family 20 glycosylhydrolase [Kiritimatiellae bacterium]|nr:family 20 glycosylhydrolase [Kiritimatiellia bacterium]
MKMIAYHLDFKRAMWKNDYLARFTERLKKWGYNALLLEMEDKFRFAEHPAVSHGEAWGRAQTSAFAAKCRGRGMDVIPLMQSLGHLEFIVGKKEYAHLREAPDLAKHIDVTNPDAIPFLTKLYDEIIAVVRPEKYFHLGGDETWALGNSRRCAPLLRKFGRGGLYLRHMRPLWEHIHQRGLTPVIWADMVLSHPDILGKIPKYVALMDWNYWITNEREKSILVWGGFGRGNRWFNLKNLNRRADRPFRRHLLKYALDRQTRRDKTFRAFYCADALHAKGFTVLTAPASRCAGDLIGIPLSSRHIPNCYYVARRGVRGGKGTLVTSWAVRHNHPETNLPAAYAAVWGLKRKGDFDQRAFWKDYTAGMYGVDLPCFGEAVAFAEKGAGIPFLQAHILQNKVKTAGKKRCPLAKPLADFARARGGRRATRIYLESILEDYEKAAVMFRGFRRNARRNAGNFDFWLEGIAVDGLLIRAALAVLKKSLPGERKALICALRRVRRQTARLFAATYLPQSVQEELKVRYEVIAGSLGVWSR